MTAPSVGVDLGGTKVLAVAVERGSIVARTKRKTPRSGGPEDVVDAIVGAVDELGVGRGAAVGVGAPGIVDAERGVVVRAPNLPGWDRPFPLGPELSRRLDAPVRLDNDVNAAALAEHRLGAARGADDVLTVFVGTGVGAGLILEGTVRRGPRGIAGEIGHTVVHPGGRECACGGRGHLEAYAGRGALEREARRRAAAGEATLLVELAGARRMTSSTFAKALSRGDEVATMLVGEAVEALGVALANAAAVCDLTLVVLGGGIAHRLGAPFAADVEAAVARHFFADAPLPVVRAALGDDGGALGAALLPGTAPR